MLDLPSTLVLSCLMAALSSKSGLRNTLNTIIICLIYVLGGGFALGLLFATYDSINSHITGFEWTLERCETDFKYLFVAIAFPSLVFFSSGGLGSGLDDNEDVLTDVDNEISSEPRQSDDGDHQTMTPKYNKEQNVVNTMMLTVDTLWLRMPLGGRDVSRRRVSQDFTINRAMKKMKIVHHSPILNTLTPSPTVPSTMVLNIAALQNQPKDQSTRHANQPSVDLSSRKLGRLLLKDFLALKAGVKIPSPEESVFISEVDKYAQLKSRAMNKVSEPSTSESVCSSLSGESFFQAGVRLTMSSKIETSRKRSAKSPPGSGLLDPESEFQARLRSDMQKKGESRRMRSGMSTPGSVSSSTSEESDFQTEFRKAMWPNGETPTGSGRSSRPSTPGSDFRSGKLEL